MPLTYRLDQNEIGDADCADGHEPEADLDGEPPMDCVAEHSFSSQRGID